MACRMMITINGNKEVRRGGSSLVEGDVLSEHIHVMFSPSGQQGLVGIFESLRAAAGWL